MLDPSRIAPALDHIDPQSRALIELCHRRGLAESDIEDMLGIAQGDLGSKRTAAEIELAAELGSGLGELHAALPELSEEAWTGQAYEAPPDFEPGATVEPFPEFEPLHGDAPPGEGGSGLALWIGALIAGLATAAIVLVVVVANADEGDAGADDGPLVELQRLNGTDGNGTVQLTGPKDERRVRLDVRDFPEPQGGGYAVWLYKSPTEAKRLKSIDRSAFAISLALPPGYRRYRFLDVSREAEGDAGQIGQSLLRTSVAGLARR